MLIVFLFFPEKQQAGRNRQQGVESDQQGGVGGQQDSGGGGNNQQQDNTWVHEIFQAVVTRELKCLNCEAVSPLRALRNQFVVYVCVRDWA